MQRVQRNCTTDGAKYRCRSSASSSVNELAVRKASARSTTEQLFDEEFGVSLGRFPILLMDRFR